VVLAGATLGALGLSWLLASRLGADAFTLRKVLEAGAIGIPATFLPVILRIKPDYWALAVVGAGVARMMLCLGFCFATREIVPEVLSRPLFVGVGAGASLILAVEVVSSIRVLSAIERGRAGAALSSDSITRKTA
jgi:hypothetical protein